NSPLAKAAKPTWEVRLRTYRRLCAGLGVLFSTLSLFAQRKPVLQQIDAPHPYYYREMYLPQLTTGPSAAAWLPDSQSLVYSMAGSIWRQKVNSEIAERSEERRVGKECRGWWARLEYKKKV